MELIKLIFDAISRLISFVVKIIEGVLNFVKHIKEWFQSLRLSSGVDIPFIARKDALRDMIKSAPVKDVGIFCGVYNESKDEITAAQDIQADSLDRQTQDLLKGEPLVVLK